MDVDYLLHGDWRGWVLQVEERREVSILIGIVYRSAPLYPIQLTTKPLTFMEIIWRKSEALPKSLTQIVFSLAPEAPEGGVDSGSN